MADARIAATWDCSHSDKEVGHTTLYTIREAHPRDPADAVLYIGITGNVKRRFKQHRSKKEWWGDAGPIALECYDSWESACEAETTMIEWYKPRHNQTGNALRIIEDKAAIICRFCGFALRPGNDEYDENVGSPYPEHWRCGQEIVMAYEMGCLSVLPEDSPLAIAIRRGHALNAEAGC